MSQTRDQKQLTISELAADWQVLMISQQTMRPSINQFLLQAYKFLIKSILP